MDPRTVERAIAAGVAALAAMQKQDGGFPFGVRKSGTWTPCSPVFATACILLAAGARLPRDSARRAAEFVRRERRGDGLWVYDAATHVPPDVDTTACAFAALKLHGDAADLADGPALLRSFWRAGGGPFQTWRDDAKWSTRDRDDAVVNCNVLFALARLGAPATAAEHDAVRDLLARSVHGARYYCAPAAIAHAARRAGLPLEALPPIAVVKPPARRLLACMLWLTAMPEPDAKIVAAILTEQRPDGSWPVRPWCKDGGEPGYVWGSPAVTTALAIEALSSHHTSIGP